MIKHVDTNAGTWRAMGDGVKMLLLRAEPGELRVLLTFEPGKGYPRHAHPAGEEVFVLDGVYCDMGVEYGPGSYLYYPPGSDHAPVTSTGCTIMVMSPERPKVMDA